MLFKEKQQVIICVIAGVIAVGFILFRHMPLRKRIRAIESERGEIQRAIAEASEKSEQLPALKKQLTELEVLVGNYDKQIPVGRDIGGFLQRIASLMNTNKLKGQLVQPGKETKANELHCIPVKIHCKGRLEQVFEFYKSLQKMGRLIRIEQVRLYNSSDFSGEINMQTKAIIYHRSESKGNKV